METVKKSEEVIDVVCGLSGRLGLNGPEVLLSLRHPNIQYGNTWEVPGGKCEVGETKEQALIREWKEEMGVDISVKKYLWSVGPLEHKKHIFYVHYYEITVVSGTPKSTIGQEISYFSPDQLRNITHTPGGVSCLNLMCYWLSNFGINILLHTKKRIKTNAF